MRMMYNWAAGPDGEGEGPQHGRGANDEGHTERKVCHLLSGILSPSAEQIFRVRIRILDLDRSVKLRNNYCQTTK